LYYLVDIPYIIAHIFAFFVALANSFVMNALWTFKNLKHEQVLRQITVFIIVGMVGLILSTLTIYILANYFPVILAKIVAIGVSLTWNYVGSWIFVFRK
jgi:putative flippase GtrA